MALRPRVVRAVRHFPGSDSPRRRPETARSPAATQRALAHLRQHGFVAHSCPGQGLFWLPGALQPT